MIFKRLAVALSLFMLAGAVLAPYQTFADDSADVMSANEVVSPDPSLFVSTRLSKGAEGTEVTILQAALQDLGYLVQAPTGYFGAATLKAVQQFQKSLSLDPVGFLGPTTRSLLNSKIQSSSQTAAAVASAISTTSPILTMSLDTMMVPRGGTVTLTWSATSATSCAAGSNWNGPLPTAGSHVFTNIQEARTWSITCKGAGGSTTQSVTVKNGVPGAPVNTPPTTPADPTTPATPGTPTAPSTPTIPTTPVVSPSPKLDFSSSAPTVSSGASVTLTWKGSNINSCTVTGGWTGTQSGTGTKIITNITKSQTYTISCMGAGGTITKSIYVTVNPAISVPPPLYGGSCAPDAATKLVGQTSTWTLTPPTGGTGTSTFEWSGSDTLLGSGTTLVKTYSTPGFKVGAVYVQSGTQTKTIVCTPIVVVNPSIPVTVPTAPTVPVTTPSAPSVATGVPIMNGATFTGPDGYVWSAQSSSTPDSLTIEPGGIYRFHITPNDHWPNDGAGTTRNRSEISGLTVPAQGYSSVSYDVKVDKTDTVTAGLEHVFGQRHGKADKIDKSGEHPDIAFRLLAGGRPGLTVAGSAEQPLVNIPKSQYPWQGTASQFALGTWHTIKINSFAGANGWVDLYLDGQLMKTNTTDLHTYSGPFGYVNVADDYWKFGEYAANGEKSDTIVEYRNIVRSLTP